VFGYCIVVSLTAFSVICNKTFYKVYTLLSHTPHHTKSPLGSRRRDSLGAVSYSFSVVTMAVSVAVCEIFSVKEWRDLEDGVRFVQGHWKWHHDRSRTSSYSPYIVTMAISCIACEI